jgi:hypothetical protein
VGGDAQGSGFCGRVEPDPGGAGAAQPAPEPTLLQARDRLYVLVQPEDKGLISAHVQEAEAEQTGTMEFDYRRSTSLAHSVAGC